MKREEFDIQNLTQVGRGACSNVYRYNENTVLKILNESGRKMYDEQQFSKIVGIDNSTCIFPKEEIPNGNEGRDIEETSDNSGHFRHCRILKKSHVAGILAYIYFEFFKTNFEKFSSREDNRRHP